MHVDMKLKPDVQEYLSCLLIQKHSCCCTIQWSYKSPYDPTATVIVRDEFGQGAVKIMYDIPKSIITDMRLTPKEKASEIYSEIKGFLNG